MPEADHGRERRHRIAGAPLLAVVLVTVLVTLLLAWAATQGPGTVLSGDGPWERPTGAEPTSQGPDMVQTPDPQDQARTSTDPTHDLSWLGWLIQVAILVAVLLLAARVVVGLVRRWRDRRRPERSEDVEFDVLGSPERLARAFVEDAGTQQQELATGPPRNGIVAAWSRFELQAADLGANPHPWETSSEFTLRILDRIGADAGAVQRLAELFREARYSEHPMDEADRDAAAEALERIRLSLTGLLGGPR